MSDRQVEAHPLRFDGAGKELSRSILKRGKQANTAVLPYHASGGGPY